MKKVFMTIAMVAALACAVSCGNNTKKAEGECKNCECCEKCAADSVAATAADTTIVEAAAAAAEEVAKTAVEETAAAAVEAVKAN